MYIFMYQSQPANVQVTLYDDRLEATSPGMLSGDLTIKRMKEGYSKIRNRGIARAFLHEDYGEVGERHSKNDKRMWSVWHGGTIID